MAIGSDGMFYGNRGSAIGCTDLGRYKETMKDA